MPQKEATAEVATEATQPAATDRFANGNIVTGTVTKVDFQQAELDMGDGEVGVLSSRHYATGLLIDLTGELKVGDEVEAAVLVRADHKNRVVLSRTWARTQKAWKMIAEAQAKDSLLEAIIFEDVKGGFRVVVNEVQGFLPSSLAVASELPDEPVGTVVKCKVVEANQEKGRFVVSHKAGVRVEEKEKEREVLKEFKKGDTVSGKVVGIEEYGAFVDIGGARGLLHRTEMSWNHLQDPQDVLQMGEEITCEILKVNAEKIQLSLTLRMGDNPIGKVAVGQRLQGKVDRLAYTGAIVELDIPDYEPVSEKCKVNGFVHVNDMSEHPVRRPQRLVLPGDEVAVKVIEVKKKQNRIGLSIADAVVPDAL